MGTEILDFCIARPATEEMHSISEVEAEMESRIEQDTLICYISLPRDKMQTSLEQDTLHLYISQLRDKMEAILEQEQIPMKIEVYWSDMSTHSLMFILPRRTTYKEQEQVEKDFFKIIQGFTHRETGVSVPETLVIYRDDVERSNSPFLEPIQRSEMDGLSNGGCSQSLGRSTYQEQEPEIPHDVFITEHEIKQEESKLLPERGQPWGIEECLLFMRTHSGWFNPPRRTTHKEQEQVKEDNFKRIQGEVEAEMASRIEQERVPPWGIEDCWLFDLPVSERVPPWGIEDDLSYMWTHPGWFNPPSRTTYKEHEQVKKDNFKIIQGEVEAEMESFEEQERGQPRGIEECWLFMRTHSGWFNPPRRTTHKEQEQVKEDNFKRIQGEVEAEMESLEEQECKEKIVIVNGPEIQQPNHYVLDKEQQDFIGVRKSSQSTKGLNINLETSFSFIKYSLILILVGFPVADCNHPDFKWLPTNKIVKEVFQKDAPLVWRYQSNLKVDKIDISRKKTENEKEDVALWTPDEGSKPNTLLSTDVTLEHRKEGDVGTIILTIINPYPVDFDKQYYCAVSFEHGVDSMEIELQSYRVEYQPVADVVKARPGDDVQFVWIYKYPLPLTFVDFYKNDDIQDDILRWSRSDGVYDIEDEYKNRIDVTITKNKDQEEVTLTLRNVTRGDFDHTYHSLVIPANGYFKSSKITLDLPLTVEEEKPKPVQETISTIKKTISTPSSASRLSKVSMFLICSVLLLAV